MIVFAEWNKVANGGRMNGDLQDFWSCDGLNDVACGGGWLMEFVDRIYRMGG